MSFCRGAIKNLPIMHPGKRSVVYNAPHRQRASGQKLEKDLGRPMSTEPLKIFRDPLTLKLNWNSVHSAYELRMTE